MKSIGMKTGVKTMNTMTTDDVKLTILIEAGSKEEFDFILSQLELIQK